MPDKEEPPPPRREGKPPCLSDAEFSDIAKFIHGATGINYSERKKYLVENRIAPLLEVLGINSYREYLRVAASSAEEKARLINSITTSETCFFRNPPQLEALNSIVLPEIVRCCAGKNRKRLRIWSAASSTGEEIYSIAMTLKENAQLSTEWEVDLFATDINGENVERARQGVYNKYSVRNTPAHLLRKYFVSDNGREFRIRSELLPKVVFERLNLMDIPHNPKYRDFDIVFCCNVLIYLCDRSKEKVVADIFRSLGRPGFLFIGHSESLHNLSKEFKLVNANGTPLYIKE